MPNTACMTTIISYSNFFSDEDSEAQRWWSGNPNQAILTLLLVQLLIPLSSHGFFSVPRDPGNSQS